MNKKYVIILIVMIFFIALAVWFVRLDKEEVVNQVDKNSTEVKEEVVEEIINESIELNRWPITYEEMQEFIKPEEVKNYSGNIYFPSNISKERIEKIVDHMETVMIYSSDIRAFRESEYWQTPSEVLKNRRGDCEDWAVTTLSLIRADNPKVKCYNAILPTHINLFCYSDGVVGFYDQEGIRSRTTLMFESEEEDKIRLRSMAIQYFRKYGIPAKDRGVEAILNDKEIIIFENNEGFIGWIYDLFKEDFQ